MLNSVNQRKAYVSLMVLSAVLGIIYILVSHMDFLMNAVEYRAITLTNFCYGIFRLECLVLPLVFVSRRNAFFPKILTEKFLLGLFGVCCLSGVMWIFSYLNYNDFRDLYNDEGMYIYQGITTNYIAANRLMWGTTNFAGVVFSLVLSIMYFATSLLMHRHRGIVAACFAVITLYRILTPIIYMTVLQDFEVFSEWIGNNIFSLLSGAFMTLGIWLVSNDDALWLECIWGEEAPDDEEDGEY